MDEKYAAISGDLKRLEANVLNLLIELKKIDQSANAKLRTSTVKSELEELANRLKATASKIQLETIAESRNESSPTQRTVSETFTTPPSISTLDAVLSVLDSLMWTRDKKDVEPGSLAAMAVEDILSSAINSDGSVITTSDVMGSKESEFSGLSLIPPPNYSLPYLESSSQSQSYNIDHTRLSASSKFLENHKLLEKLIIKLKLMDRKLADMALTGKPGPDMINVTDTKAVQTEPRLNEIMPKLIVDAGTSISKEAFQEPTQARKQYSRKTSTREPRLKSQFTQTLLPEKPLSEEAQYWKKLSHQILQELVDKDVENFSALTYDLNRLPSPVQNQDQNDYWVIQANHLFKMLLKQKKCNPKVWRGLMPYSTIETGMKHLCKRRFF